MVSSNKIEKKYKMARLQLRLIFPLVASCKALWCWFS